MFDVDEFVAWIANLAALEVHVTRWQVRVLSWLARDRRWRCSVMLAVAFAARW